MPLPHPPKPRVMVVNDDTTQLNMLCGLLQKAGLEPVPFKSAETALVAMVQGVPPVLIVTDLYMPGIDGWQFCRLLRSPEFSHFNQIPILVVSATFSGDEPSRITSDLGANVFLPMPFKGQQFLDQVQALLNGEKMQDILKVLIVEDSKLISSRLLKVFQVNGYTADAAFSYQEALAMLAQTAYDVAVLDYHLPDGFGDGLLKHLRDKSSDCVSIMMTADPQPELALTWMKLGASAYLRKPFEPEYLIAQCERVRRERALLRIQDLLQVRTHQLHESELYLRAILQTIKDGFWVLDASGKFLDANLAYCEMSGYSLTELQQLSINDLDTLEDPAMTAVRIRRLIENKSEQFETRQCRKDGSIFDVEISTTYWGNDGGRFICFCRDITGRKQAEAKLRESEEKYRLLVEYSSDLIWNLTAEGIFSYVSPSWEHVVGYLPSTLVGTSFQLIVHPDDIPACLKYLEWMTHRSVFASTPEYRVRHADGTWHWHEGVTTPVLGADKEFISLVGVSRDITDRKQTEEARRQSEERYHLIDEASQDLIYSYDRQSRFTHANSKMCLLLGFNLEQIIGKTHAELGFPQEQCDEWDKLHQQIFDTDTTVISETMTPIHEGEPQYFEVVLNPIHDDTGAIIGIAGTTRDINAKKMAEKKIKAQIEELQRWHNITLGREDRILELKREVNKLLAEAGKPLHYASVQEAKHE